MSSRARDIVNSPEHYTAGGIETIDYLEAKLTREAFIGYLRGNALKYLSRMWWKSAIDALTDARKAQWYLNRMIAKMSADGESTVCAWKRTPAQDTLSSPHSATDRPFMPEYVVRHYHPICPDCHKPIAIAEGGGNEAA